MTALVHYTDPLLVRLDQAIAGGNLPDDHSVWHGLGEITFTDGGLEGSQWYRDNGPRGLDPALLEPRAFCSKGGCEFLFTGTGLIVRMNIAYGWVTDATVLIDGVAPSTLGLLAFSDTISSHAGSYPVEMEALGYTEVVVADGLIDGAHDVVILIDNADAAKFWSIAGFRIPQLGPTMLTRTAVWVVDSSTMYFQNIIEFRLLNRNPLHAMHNVVLSIDANLLEPGTGFPFSPIGFGTLLPGDGGSQQVLPYFTGDEPGGTYDYEYAVTAEYFDDDGVIEHLNSCAPAAVGTSDDGLYTRETLVLAPYPTNISVIGTFSDAPVPVTGEPRIFWNGREATTSGGHTVYCHVAFTFYGDELLLTVQRDGGFGTAGLFSADAPIYVPGGAGGEYEIDDELPALVTFDCDPGVSPVGVHTFTFTGFGPGRHHVHMKKLITDGKYVVFVKAEWTETYTEVAQVNTLRLEVSQPYAMQPTNVAMVEGFYDVAFDPPDLEASDFTGPIPYTNQHLAYSETMWRFPTFAVCYQGGYREELAGYDLLIIDPLAASVEDVEYWQSLGIKVFGYVASGEEVGFYSERYNFFSALDAYKDGTGPGGYAQYYMFTANPVTGPPDKNGVWASYYINPDPAFGWPARLENFYRPQLYDGSEVVPDEVVTLINPPYATALPHPVVFDTAKSPIDISQNVSLVYTLTPAEFIAAQALYGVNATESLELITFTDYTFDPKTGAFVLSIPNPPVPSTTFKLHVVQNLLIVGKELTISYTRKGHHLDGVFWDVVDTPDVYAGPEFGYEYVEGYDTKFIEMLNTFKAIQPEKMMISNRGFTILPHIIRSCTGVMFESWLSHPLDIGDLANTDYAAITDPDAVAYNQAILDQLRGLRMEHTFDVYSLNYAKHEDTALQEYCRKQDARQGYMSWQTTITLTTPNHNTTIDTPAVPVVTNQYVQNAMKRWGAPA